MAKSKFGFLNRANNNNNNNNNNLFNKANNNNKLMKINILMNELQIFNS